MLVLIQANNIIWDSIDITRSRGIALLMGNGVRDQGGNTPCSGTTECAWYSNIKFLRSDVSHIRGTGIQIMQADGVLFDGGSMEDSNNTAAYEKAGALSDPTEYSLIGWGNGIRITGTNITIAHSRVFHNWGEAFSIDVRDGDTWGPDKNITIDHNEIYDNWPGNFYVDAVDNIAVTGNIFYQTGDPKLKSPEWGNGDPYNVVVETEHGGYGATNMLFANNIVSGGSSNLSLQQYQGNTHYANLHFFNNTFLDPQTGSLDGGFVNSTDIELVNNIFYAPGKPIFTPYGGFTSRTDLVFSHNLWSSSPVSVQAPGNGTSDPQANLNGVGDIITTNPGLANPNYTPTPGSFDANAIKLVSGSPALNAGNNISSVTNDFFGTARPNGLYDIGAYQHGAAQGVGAAASTPPPGIVVGGFPTLPAGQTNVCGGTRDMTKMFFASNSIWNTPIGSGAQFGPAYIHPIPDQSELETVNGQLLFDPAKDGNSQPFTNIDETEFSPVILQMDPSQPLTDVKYNANGPAGWGTGDTCVATEPQTNFQIPWPQQYFIPTHAVTKSDGHTAVIGGDGRTFTAFAYITRCEGQGYITSYDRTPHYDDICGEGRYGTHGASNMDAEGGLLRRGELTPTLGAPKHVLAINLREYWMRHITDPDGDGVSHVEERVWPAQLFGGGYSGEYSVYGVGNVHGYDTDVRQGSLVAIPPNIDINNMGLYTEPGKMLAWTLQNYGAYVTDTGGGALGFYGEAGPDVNGANQMGFLSAFGAAWSMPFRAVVGWTKQYGNGTFPFGDDINTIGRALRVVINNGPNSVGGGGTPDQPATPN
jgi:hypothetical protein